MLEPVAIEKIIGIIRDKDAYLDDINQRVQSLMSYVSTDQVTVDVIHELFMPKPSAGIGLSSGGSGGGDYADMIETYLKRQVYQKKELRELLIELIDEKELIERVWGCYKSLPYLPHIILHKYYQEKMILDAIALELDISRRSVQRYRDMALKMISERYISGVPLNVIFKLQKKHNKRIEESNNNIKVIFEMDKKEEKSNNE